MKPMFSHPSDETLTELALTETLAHDLDRVEQHVAECARCRDTMRGVRAMRTALVDASVPEASEEILMRILQRRLSGERTQLTAPEHSESTDVRGAGGRRGLRVPRKILMLAAAAAAVVLWMRWPEDSSRSAEGLPIVPRPPALDEYGALPSVWPSVAYAATPPKDTQPLYEPLTVVLADSSLRGARAYVRSSASSYHDYMPIEAIKIAIADTLWQKQRVWRIVTTDPFAHESRASAETLWVSRGDLKLLFRRVNNSAFSFSQRAASDTTLENTYEVTLPARYRDTITPLNRRHVYTTRTDRRRIFVADQSMFMLMLRSQQLSPTWRGSIAVNSYRGKRGLGGEPTAVNVSVQGDSVVNTLWGHVPAWRVVVHTSPVPERWYVSKEGHEVLLVTGPNGMAWPRSRLDLIGRFVK